MKLNTVRLLQADANTHLNDLIVGKVSLKVKVSLQVNVTFLYDKASAAYQVQVWIKLISRN